MFLVYGQTMDSHKKTCGSSLKQSIKWDLIYVIITHHLRSLFTWGHVCHIGVLKQRNGGHVGVPNHPCLLLFQLHSCWSVTWVKTLYSLSLLQKCSKMGYSRKKSPQWGAFFFHPPPHAPHRFHPELQNCFSLLWDFPACLALLGCGFFLE